MKFNVTKLAPSERGKRKRETDSNIYFLSGINSIIKERKKRKTREQERRGLLSISRLRSASCRFSHSFSRNRVSQLRCSYFPPLDKGKRERERIVENRGKSVVNPPPIVARSQIFRLANPSGVSPSSPTSFPRTHSTRKFHLPISVSQEIINNTFTFCSEIF